MAGLWDSRTAVRVPTTAGEVPLLSGGTLVVGDGIAATAAAVAAIR